MEAKTIANPAASRAPVRPDHDPKLLAATRRAVVAAMSPEGMAQRTCLLHEDSVEKLLSISRGFAAIRLLTDFSRLTDRLRRGERDATGVVSPIDSVAEISADWKRIEVAQLSFEVEVAIWRDFWRRRSHALRRGDIRWPAYKIFLQLERLTKRLNR